MLSRLVLPYHDDQAYALHRALIESSRDICRRLHHVVTYNISCCELWRRGSACASGKRKAESSQSPEAVTWSLLGGRHRTNRPYLILLYAIPRNPFKSHVEETPEPQRPSTCPVAAVLRARSSAAAPNSTQPRRNPDRGLGFRRRFQLLFHVGPQVQPFSQA